MTEMIMGVEPFHVLVFVLAFGGSAIGFLIGILIKLTKLETCVHNHEKWLEKLSDKLFTHVDTAKDND